MTLTSYLVVQQIVMAVIAALGVQLIFDAPPKELKGEDICDAIRVMGAAMIVIPLASFIYFFRGMASWGEHFATAINLCAYCLTSILISCSYLILFSRDLDYKIIKVFASVGVVFDLALWLCVRLGSELVIRQSLIIGYTFFAVLVVIQIVACILFYKAHVRSFKGDITAHKSKEIRWIRHSMIVAGYLAIISVLAPLFYEYPLWLGGVYVCASVIGFIAIYISFRRMINCRARAVLGLDVEESASDAELCCAVVHDLDIKSALRDDVKLHIEKHLVEWLDRRGYADNGVSINTVAKSVYTNRTYLSRYVNVVYGCSFRTWVTNLRIDEAKYLLVSHPELQLSEIATMVGSSSQESFTHTFTDHVGVSPHRWREQNRHIKKVG